MKLEITIGWDRGPDLDIELYIGKRQYGCGFYGVAYKATEQPKITINEGAGLTGVTLADLAWQRGSHH